MDLLLIRHGQSEAYVEGRPFPLIRRCQRWGATRLARWLTG